MSLRYPVIANHEVIHSVIANVVKQSPPVIPSDNSVIASKCEAICLPHLHLIGMFCSLSTNPLGNGCLMLI